MGLLEKLKRKNPRVKNPVFVEAGRRGGLMSGEVRRARAEQRRLMEEGSPPTKLAEKMAAILETPREPRSLDPIDETASPTTVEPAIEEEMMEEVGAPEASGLSSLEPALEATESELSDIKQIRERPEAELADIKSMLPSPQLVEKAMEELEYVKPVFKIPYTLSIFEKLSNRGAGKGRISEESEKGVEVPKEEVRSVAEEVKRILQGTSR